MSDLPPIPDPHTPPTPKNEPIWWWDLVLAGLIYAVGVPAIYLLLRSLGLFTYGFSTAFGAQVTQMGMATFVFMRFGKSIRDGKNEDVTSHLPSPMKMNVALSFLLSTLCIVQEFVFQSVLHWIIPLKAHNYPSYFFYNQLIVTTAFMCLPILGSLIESQINRKKQQNSKQ